MQELYQNIAQLNFGKKPGLFSSKQLKELASHPKLNDLFRLVDETEKVIATKTSTPLEIMTQFAKIEAMYLEHKEL